MRPIPHRPSLFVMLLAGAVLLSLAAHDAFAVRYTYDALGRIQKVIDDSGEIAEYVYDSGGNIVEIRRGTLAALEILAFAPSRGPVGTFVTIDGQGFSAQANLNTVRIGGVVATVIDASAEVLTITVPDTAASGLISVEVGVDTVDSDSAFTVLPSISAVTPEYVLAGVTTQLQFVGNALGGATVGVSPPAVGGLTLGVPQIDSTGTSGSVDVTPGATRAGSFNLIATTADGSSASTGASLFTVLGGDWDDDGDGLNNAQELALGTNPRNSDTDGDGVPDGVEVTFGTDPLSAAGQPIAIDFRQNPVPPGGNALIEIAVSNLSAEALQGVRLELGTPTGGSFHESNDAAPNADSVSCGGTASSAATCTPGETARWSLGTLNPGVTRVIDLRVTLDAGLLPDTLIDVPVRLTSDSLASASVVLTRSLEIGDAPELLLGASVNPVVADETYTYLVRAANPGAADLDNVSVRLTLPAVGVTLEDGDGGLFDAGTRTVEWSSVSLPAGGGFERAVEVSTGQSLTDGLLLSADLELLASDDSTLRQADNTVSVDAARALSGHAEFVLDPATGRMNHKIVISNLSGSSLTSTVVTLRTPDEFTFHETSNAMPNATSTSCGGTASTAATCTGGEEAFWSLGTLLPGASVPIDIDTTVTTVQAGRLVAPPVVVTAAGVDPVSLTPAAVVGSVDVELALAPSTDPVQPGAPLTWLLDVANPSGTDLSGGSLVFYAPSPGSIADAGQGGVIDPGADTVTWPVGIAAGDGLQRTVTVNVAAAATQGAMLPARAEFTLAGAAETYATVRRIVRVGRPVALVGSVRASPAPVTADGQLAYEITVSNVSAAPLTGVEVRLRTPDEITFHESSNAVPNAVSTSCGGTASTAVTCTDGEEAIWSLFTLAAGESRTIDLTTTVLAGVAQGTLITMPVHFSASGVDTVTLERTVRVDSVPPLALALAASTDPVAPGAAFTYLVDIGNPTLTAQGNVSVRLVLPDQVTVDAVSGGGAVDGTTGDVLWTLSSLNAGGSVRRAVDVTVAGATAEGTILEALLDVRLDGSAEVDVSVAQTVTVSGIPGFTALLLASPDPVGAEGQLNYEITVGNGSDVPIAGAEVRLRTPAEITFHESNNAVPNASSASCGGTSGTETECTAGEEAFWSLGTLAAGESRTIDVSASVLAGVADGSLITMPLFVTGTGAPAVSVERTVHVDAAAPLALALGASRDPVTSGETFTYTVDAGNPTLVGQTNVALRLVLPDLVAAGLISDGGIVEGATGDVLWTLASLSAGGSVRRSVDVTVGGGVSNATILEASIQARLDGSTETDASAAQAVTVDGSVALTGLLLASPDPVAADGQLNYEVTVSNVSSSPVLNVAASIRTPAEITFHEANNAVPDASSASCGGTSGTQAICTGGEEAFWALGTLAAGESRTIDLSAAVLTDVVDGTLITMPLFVSGTGADGVSVERTVHVDAAAPLALALGASQDPVAPGTTFTYAVDVGNPTLVDQTNVALRLDVPDMVTVDTISDGGGVDGATGDVVWTLSSLSAGGSVRRTVDVTVDSGLADGTILEAGIQAFLDGSTETDASAAQAVTVDGSVALTGLLLASPDPVAADGQLNYEITVSNVSVSPVATVAVNIRTPAEITFHEANNAVPNATSSSCGGTSGTQLTCTGGEEAFWALGTLAAGESRKIDVSAAVLADVVDGTLITMPLFVSGVGADGVSVERTVRVDSAPPLAIALGATKDPAAPGATYSYVVDVGNPMASNQSNVGVRLVLPDQVTVGAISDGGTVEAVTGDVLWTLASLSAGSAARRTVEVSVAAAAPDGEILQAQAEARLDGSTETDASAAQAVTVDGSLALTALLLASPDPVAAGGQLNYEITVANVSGDDVAGVQVNVRTPAEVTFHESNNAVPDAVSSSCGGTSGTQTICTGGEEAVWTLGTLAAGQTRNIDLSAAVVGGVADGSLITMPLFVSGSGADGVSVERTVRVDSAPPLALALGATASPVLPGSSYGYTIDAANPTPVSQSNVDLRLVVPDDVSVDSVSDGGVLDAGTGDVLWTLSSLGGGSATRRTVDVTVGAAVADGTILEAQIEARLAGSSETDASAAQAVAVDGSLALTGNLVASPDPVAPNGQLNYEITIANVSAVDVSNIEVSVRTPAQLTFHESIDANPSASSVSCGGTSGTQVTCTGGEEAFWSFGGLAAGGSLTINLRTTVLGAVGDGELITMPLFISGSGADAISVERTVVVEQ